MVCGPRWTPPSLTLVRCARVVLGKSRALSSIETRLETLVAHGTEGHGVPPKSPSGSGSPCPQASGSLPHHRLCSSPNFPPMKGPVTSGDLTGLRWNMAAPERSSLSVLECCSHTRFTRTQVSVGTQRSHETNNATTYKNKVIQTSCEQNIQFSLL